MKKKPHQLRKRLDQLPRPVYDALYRHCIEVTGLSHVAWGNMCRGSTPHISFVVELCDIFQVTPRQLLDPSTELRADLAQIALSINV